MHRLIMLESKIKALKNDIKKHPDDLPMLSELVGLLRSAGKYDQAISMLERFLARHPDDFNVLIIYGEALLDLEVFDDAIRVLRRASEIKPCAQGHYAVARAYDLKGLR
jgi:predicted Zn-dependent protease